MKKKTTKIQFAKSDSTATIPKPDVNATPIIPPDLTFKKEINPDIAPIKQRLKPIKFLSDNIIELILIGIGLLLLTQPTMQNIKISFTLILIATFLVFLFTGEHDTAPYYEIKIQKDSLRKKIQSIALTDKITIVLILWTLLLFTLTKDIEVYFILIFIGILIIREITDMHITTIYKKRLNAYILIFLLAYIVLISQKIMDIITT